MPRFGTETGLGGAIGPSDGDRQPPASRSGLLGPVAWCEADCASIEAGLVQFYTFEERQTRCEQQHD